MRKRLRWILFAAAILILITYGFIHYFSQKTKFNNTYVNGNTAGNLYNNGLFCEYDGKVYFANPNDNFSLYSMPVSGGKATKICDDIVTYLNVDKHYIYYARNNIKKDTASSSFGFLNWNSNSLCRIKHNGSHLTILDDAPSMYASLLGNYLYYIHYDTDTASTMYKVKIDGTKASVVEKQPYFTCSTSGSYLYYNGLENDHKLYSLNTATNNVQTLYEDDCWMPTVERNIAYFIDPSNNYCLTKVDLNTKETYILTEERIDCYNIYGSYIYYSRNENPALFRMKLDGSQKKQIIDGACCDINITSRYVYFRKFNNPEVYYCTPTNGSVNVTVFSPETN